MEQFRLKPEDRAPADDDRAPVLAHVETVQPRRVRSQLAMHGAELLALQDDFEGLLAHISSQEGRASWRRLHKALSNAHERVRSISESVERGG